MKLLALIITPLTVGTLAAEMVSDEQIRFLILIGGLVAAIVGALRWNQKQMREVVTAHAKEDIQRYNAVLRELVLMNHTQIQIAVSLGLPPPVPIRAEFSEEVHSA